MLESQISRGLPLEEIKKVVVQENHEPLVEIEEGERIQLLQEHKHLSPYVRKSVAKLLFTAAGNLPHGHKLLIICAYRPLWMQKELWRRRLRQMAKEHPFKMIFQYRKLKKRASKYTAPPGGSSHQSGGAVDLTVIDSTGNQLDKGTTLTDYGERVHMYNDLITEIQKQNRATQDVGVHPPPPAPRRKSQCLARALPALGDQIVRSFRGKKKFPIPLKEEKKNFS